MKKIKETDESLSAVLKYMRSKQDGMTRDDIDEYGVEYMGKSVLISKPLVEQQNIDADTLEDIKHTHLMRLMILEEMENTDGPSRLIELSKEVTQIDFILQKLWGFDEDKNNHRWFELPKCNCPKLDNIDYLGTSNRSYSRTCPIHFAKLLKSMCDVIETDKW